MYQFDPWVTGALEWARGEALARKHGAVEAVHLLWGLMSHPKGMGAKLLKGHAPKVEALLGGLPVLSSPPSLDEIQLASSASEWLTLANARCAREGREEITQADLLHEMGRFFPDLAVEVPRQQEQERPDYLIDLNELASEGKLDPVIGRQKEIRAVMEILGRRNKNNPVLVGPAGVGKTAIVEGLADAIVKGKVSQVLEGRRVYSLDLGGLMAGTKFRGEFEQRLKELMTFIKGKAHEAILFIDEIHLLVGAGKTDGAMDAANLLKPALARGELNCIGATTFDEYQKYILGDGALDRRFRPVTVNAPSREDGVEILMGIREKLEAHHGVKISDQAVYQSVFLSQQYIPEKNLPDKAIDLLDEAASSLKLSAESMPAKLVELEGEIRAKKIHEKVRPGGGESQRAIEELERAFAKQRADWEKEVGSMKETSKFKALLDRYKFELEQAQRLGDFEKAGQIKYALIPEAQKKLESMENEFILQTKHVAQVISRQKGIPLEKILQSRQDHILGLREHLQKQIFGQQGAVEEVSEILITSHAGLSDAGRPLGSFLLKGPSGVGKTETAKQVCSFLFDTQEHFTRIDLSEFSEKHSVAKLIGAPAGYVGYEEGGMLTEAVRRNPYHVILFDEVEKAHRDFSDILLQILDDGRLTDNKGRTVDFCNTVIFVTTNSPNIEADFRPEVLGRFDAILTYNSLNLDVMEKLVHRQVELLNERLLPKKIHITLKPQVQKQLAQQGLGPQYGARPLRGLFEKKITRPLSRAILEGAIKEGATLSVDHLPFESPKRG